MVFPKPPIAGPRRDLIGYEGNPPKFDWPGGAKIAISLVVNYEEGSELAIGDGDADFRTCVVKIGFRLQHVRTLRHQCGRQAHG